MRLPDIRIEPLNGVLFPPGHDGERSSQFDTKRSMYQAQESMLIELYRIGVERCVLRCDVLDGQIRNDGMLRSGTTPATPRVALAFEHPDQGPIIMPSGQYRRAICNVWAIARTLEMLRAIERYGVVSRGQQYGGFRALPAAIQLSESPERIATRWATETRTNAASILGHPEVRQAAYRLLARKAHSDVGGSDDAMAALNRERAILDQHAPLG